MNRIGGFHHKVEVSPLDEKPNRQKGFAYGKETQLFDLRIVGVRSIWILLAILCDNGTGPRPAGQRSVAETDANSLAESVTRSQSLADSDTGARTRTRTKPDRHTSNSDKSRALK